MYRTYIFICTLSGEYGIAGISFVMRNVVNVMVE